MKLKPRLFCLSQVLHKIEERKAHSYDEDGNKGQHAHSGDQQGRSTKNLEDSKEKQQQQHQHQHPKQGQQHGQQQDLRSVSPFSSDTFDSNPGGMNHLDTNPAHNDILSSNQSLLSTMPLMRGEQHKDSWQPARS